MALGVLVGAALASVVQGVVVSRCDAATVASFKTIVDRLISGKKDLPPNHDLQRASTDSIREASQLMLLRLAPDSSLKKLVFRAKRKIPFVCFKEDPTAVWLLEFERLIQSADAFDDFDHAVTLSQDRIHAMVADSASTEISDLFHRTYLNWVREQIDEGEEPDDIENWVTKGWQPNEEQEDLTINLFQAYCLFFQDKLKTRPEVEILAEAKQQADLHRQLTELRPAILDAMEEQGGAAKKELSVFREQLARNNQSVHEVLEKVTANHDLLLKVSAAVGEIPSTLEEIKQLLQQASEGLLIQKQTGNDSGESLVADYRKRVAESNQTLSLPVHDENGLPVRLKLSETYNDLPLLLTFDHRIHSEVSEFTNPETNEARIRDERRTSRPGESGVDPDVRCRLHERLIASPRFVIVGDPGSGKTTLLNSLAYHYAAQAPPVEEDLEARDKPKDGLPERDWLPILIRCRDLSNTSFEKGLSGVIHSHLLRFAFDPEESDRLTQTLMDRLQAGKAMLLVDGLDELPDLSHRQDLCRLLSALASSYSNVPILATSRVVGFTPIREHFLEEFDLLNIEPLGQADQERFVNGWVHSLQSNISREELREVCDHICNRQGLSNLCNTVLLLALVTQLYLRHGMFPKERINVFRRAIELIVERQRSGEGPALTINEVLPHLEQIAYEFCNNEVHYASDKKVLQSMQALRERFSDEPDLFRREPRELLDQMIERLGLLNVAGEKYELGFKRQMIQFFHPSFQEHFAGEALAHELGNWNETLDQLREKIELLEIVDKPIEALFSGRWSEPVVSGQWREGVRNCIAQLSENRTDGSVDEAIQLLLPSLETPPSEGRARAVFAMQCLSDELKLRPSTANAIFDAAIENLIPEDGFNTRNNTFMDEAISAVMQTDWEDMCRQRMIGAFIETRDNVRKRVGAVIAVNSSNPVLHPDNAEKMISPMIERLRKKDLYQSIEISLGLMELFYGLQSDDGNHRIDFLSSKLESELIEALIGQIDSHDASAVASIWALVWLTSARAANPGSASQLGERERAVVRGYITRSDADDCGRGHGCLLLTPFDGLPAFAQQDWIMSWAKAADGKIAQCEIPKVKKLDQPQDQAAILSVLEEELSEDNGFYPAIALGRFGQYHEAMRRHLNQYFLDEKRSKKERDEALFYLAQKGDQETIQFLRETIARNIPDDKKYSVTDNCILALVAIGDVDSLRELLASGPTTELHAKAYANALASMQDPTGYQELESLAGHSNEIVSNAVDEAMKRFPKT